MGIELYRSIRDWCRSHVLPTAFIVLFSVASGCDGFFPSQTKIGPPDDHTEAEGRGAMHKGGSETPFTEASGCSASDCHQSDLRGGLANVDGRAAKAPSCYQCHGVEWDEDENEENDLPAPILSHNTTRQ